MGSPRWSLPGKKGRGWGLSRELSDLPLCLCLLLGRKGYARPFASVSSDVLQLEPGLVQRATSQPRAACLQCFLPKKRSK